MGTKYKVTCSQQHVHTVDVSELEEILEWGSCPKCGSNIIDVDPPEIQAECPFCTFEETGDWESIAGWLYVGCPRCEVAGMKSSMHIRNSFYFETELYENIVSYVDTKKYKRGNRPDYWEIVIHFCERDELVSILKTGKIKASPTGYYYNEGIKAVCLTETPISYSSEIRKVHGDYGVAFRKKHILEIGGQPVLYLTDRLIKKQEANRGFSKQIKPFIQLLRIPSISPTPSHKPKIDFLYEREWRVSGDINFKNIKPLGLILPNDTVPIKFSGNEWDILISNAYRYGEIID